MRKSRKPIFLGAISLIVLVAILVAGLWPFNFRPQNRTEWLKNRNGIHFDREGMICGTRPWRASDWQTNLRETVPVSLEIGLQPEDEPNSYVAYILSFYNRSRPEGLVLGQWGSEIILRGRIRGPKNRFGFREMGMASALHAGGTRFLSITSSPEGIALYLDGVRSKFYPNIRLIADNFYGLLLLGNSPTGDEPWVGNILILAMYDRPLTPPRVDQHFHLFKQSHYNQLATQEGLVALYLFDQGAGFRIRNRSSHQPDLFIPTQFHVLQKTVLIPPWKDFRLNRSHLQDILLNIFAFVPFSFLICGFISSAARISPRRVSLMTVCLAGSISLIIELVQVYLPTRTSSLTDLVSNTFGAILGVVLFRLNLLTRLRVTGSHSRL